MEQHKILKEDMEYSAEYKKCIHDPIYFIEHYVIVNGKHITLTPYQKLILKRFTKKNIMISAKEANKRTTEEIYKNEQIQELYKEKHYQEVLNKVEEHISKQIKEGYFFVDLKTSFMYPFRDRIMEELVRNGYRVELCPSHIMSEHLMITWK